MGSNWVTTVARIGLVFLLTPFVIKTLGPDAYGVWLTITALTSYLTEIRGGLPAASVKTLAEQIGAGERGAALNRVVHSALWLYLVLAVVCALAGLGLLGGWLAIGRPPPPDIATSARVAFLLMIGQVAFGFLTHLPAAVMESHGDFVTRNGVSLGSIALQAVLTVGLLTIDANVVFLAVTLIACSVMEFVVSLGIVLRRYDGVTFGVSGRDRALIKELVQYSAWVLVLAVGGRLAFNTDAVIVSKLDSYDGVAHYSIANSIALYFMEFIAAIAIVVMPRVAQLRGAGDDAGLRDVFLRWSKVSANLALLVGGFLIVMGPEFIGFWIDAEFQAAAGPSLMVLVASFLFFLPMRGAAVPVLMAAGDIKVPSIAYALMGVVNVGISVALVPRMGILGAAIGTALPNVIFAAVVFQLACAEAKTSRLRYLGYVALRPLVGALPAFAWVCTCRWVFDARGFVGLLYSGLGTVTLFVLGAVLFVYRGDPYDDLYARVRARLAR